MPIARKALANIYFESKVKIAAGTKSALDHSNLTTIKPHIIQEFIGDYLHVHNMTCFANEQHSRIRRPSPMACALSLRLWTTLGIIVTASLVIAGLANAYNIIDKFNGFSSMVGILCQQATAISALQKPIQQ